MSNYTENQYTSDENSSWGIVFKEVKDGEKVLDIGCSSGNLGAELIKRKNCVVDGIDIDANDIKLAKKKLRKAFIVNIETDSLSALNEKYDVVLMLDVIEHLIDPVEALRKVSKLLKPEGRLLFSVPNMAHVSVRLDLLLGELNYRQTGLLDNTHMHFYTEKSLLKILKAAGYSVSKAESTTVSYPEQLLAMKLKEAGLKFETGFKSMIDDTKGNVYQFIGVAKHDTNQPEQITFPNSNPHEEHYIQIEQAIDDQHEHIKQLEKELTLKDQHISDVTARVDRITNSKSYKAAVAVRTRYHKIVGALKRKKHNETRQI